MSDPLLRGTPAPAPRFGLRRAGITLVVFTAFYWAFVHRMGLAVIAPDMERDFGMTAAALGLMGAAYFYPYALMQLPVGVLVDVIGARSTLTVSLGIAGAGSLLFAWSTGLEQALLGRLLVGFGVSTVYLAAQRLFADWYHPRQFATLGGLLNSAGNLGALSASLPLALTAATFGWRSVFAVVSASLLATALLSFAIVRSSPEGSPRPQSPASGGKQAALGDSLRVMRTSGQLWLLAAALLPYVGTRFGFQSLWGGSYLSSVYRLDTATVGGLLMAMSISAMLASPVVGYLSDRVFTSRKLFGLAGFVLYALCWLPLVFAVDKIPLPGLYGLMVLLGAFTCFWVPVYAQAKEAFPARVAGSVLAVVNFAAILGGAVFQQIMGLVIALFPMSGDGYPPEAYAASFALCLATLVAGTICLAFSRERPVSLDPASP